MECGVFQHDGWFVVPPTTWVVNMARGGWVELLMEIVSEHIPDLEKIQFGLWMHQKLDRVNSESCPAAGAKGTTCQRYVKRTLRRFGWSKYDLRIMVDPYQ